MTDAALDPMDYNMTINGVTVGAVKRSANTFQGVLVFNLYRLANTQMNGRVTMREFLTRAAIWDQVCLAMALQDYLN